MHFPCFLRQSTFALFLVPLLANAFVSDPSDLVLAWCFICAEERILLQDAWAELRGFKCYSGIHTPGRMKPRDGGKYTFEAATEAPRNENIRTL